MLIWEKIIVLPKIASLIVFLDFKIVSEKSVIFTITIFGNYLGKHSCTTKITILKDSCDVMILVDGFLFELGLNILLLTTSHA